ncbi:remodeling and spacing factor 1 [Holotrichia oblita]|uniref:Remodeling and spacing factor 1 n=1 Tax=Holotrichia oblita TaxID=644536 RepID=A0ACB9TRA3_HOLOL|nr:remodeling and spacing factor 1 [Holotrichia oblita]
MYVLDIQSWWEVPSVAHFCSLFELLLTFWILILSNLIDDLEEALLTDGTEESSWLQELIVRLLSGCLPNNEISTFNYQMFLRRLFRQKCQEHDQYNPFNTDIDFQLLPLRTKVDILHALCDFRLDAEDVLDRLKNLEADSLRVEPLGYDDNQSAYCKKEKSIWQVICFTEDDWFQLAKKFKKSISKTEKQLYNTLTENFLPELPRLFREKERLARKRLLENQPRRTSSRIRKQEIIAEQEEAAKPKKEAERLRKEQEEKDKRQKDDIEKKQKDSIEKRRREAYERRTRLKEQSDTQSDNSENRYDMAGAKTRVKKSNTRQRQNSESSTSSKDHGSVFSNGSNRSSNRSNMRAENKSAANTTTVGRQTNNSLACATGQIVIQPVSNPHRKKLKTSQVFRQTDEDLQTGMHKILDHVKNHNDAWPFVDPVDEEYAPNYYSVIRKPMDLQSMEERLERGSYKTFSKFKDDFQLIVDNCRLYNGADNEYTKMVDNLQKVFERITERYLDEITSTDEEIAVEYPDQNKDAKLTNNKRKKSDSSSVTKRKPTLAAETDDKQERSRSMESLKKDSEPEEIEEKPSPANTPPANTTTTSRKHSKKENPNVKPNKKHQKSKSKGGGSDGKSKVESGNVKKKNQKNSKTKKSAKVKSPSPVRSRSKSFSRSPSRERWSTSPPPSWPSSSPDSRFDFSPHRSKKKVNSNLSDGEKSNNTFSKHEKWKEIYKDDFDMDFLKDRSPSPGKHKDKHNKLRETIEKLKAKNEFSKLKDKEPKEDRMKENKDDNKSKIVEKTKQKVAKPKGVTKLAKNTDLEDACSTAESTQSDAKNVKKEEKKNTNTSKTTSMEALTLATEQTLKDINKWLDDTPKFSEFSSASNSPSHFSSLDDFDIKIEQDLRKKNDKIFPKKEAPSKDKKKPFNRDPTKFFRRREVQRTIDRLQPGKSKGNLISNMQNTNKPDELFPLGPLSKTKDTKNSLIVKTNDAAPKLSLGSVLDSFGAHKFVDDPKKEDEGKNEEVKEVVAKEIFETKTEKEESKPAESTSKIESKDTAAKIGSSPGKATPNLSAWFKAFGAPKVQPTQKKTDQKPDKDEKIDDIKKIVPPGDPSPTPDSPTMPHGQPTARQRKISTGSSMSERSSFSQDMDSPRVGIDERLSYPAPYPSPSTNLHRELRL